MLYSKAVEQKIRKLLEKADSVPLIYTDPYEKLICTTSKQDKIYHGAEAYLMGNDPIIAISGSEIEYSVDYFVDVLKCKLYLSNLGDELTW